MTDAVDIEQLRDADRVLALINDGTRRLGNGIDALLLKYRWRRLGHSEGELAEWLDTLGRGDMIEVLRDEPLSVRLTADGLSRLRAVSGIGGSTANPGQGRRFRFRSDWSDEQAAVHAKLSELDLRIALLGLLAALEVDQQRCLRAAAALIAWTGAGRRAEGLRLAVSVCERDGYLRLRRTERGTLISLTPHGTRFADGRACPEPLLDRAPALNPAQLEWQVLSEDEYILLASHCVLAAGFDTEFTLSDLNTALKETRLPATASTRCADLLHRYGFVDMLDPAWLQFRITDAGRELMRRSAEPANRSRVQTALSAATRLETDDF